MKILYMSCHSVLEHDEVRLLSELGHEVFSPGAYTNPAHGDGMRPGIPGMVVDPDILDMWYKHDAVRPSVDGKDYLTKEFVDKFDCIIVMHLPRWIIKNWDAMLGKRVIWRTIGQSVADRERELAPYRKKGMQIIRYSPMEQTIPGYIGEDALIRFYKDPNDYGPWVGTTKRIITFAQHMKQRNAACNYKLFETTTRSFPRHLFGPGNEGEDWTSGKVPYEQLQEEMRMNRAYFYTGTHPASYTLNFIEAWMTGIPLVAIGPKHGNASYFPGHNLYEIPQLITQGVNGFISDNPFELQVYIRSLFNDDKLAANVSAKARESAIQIFGADVVKQQWRDFLNA